MMAYLAFLLTAAAIQVHHAVSLSSVANAPAVGKGNKLYAIAMYGGVGEWHRKFMQRESLRSDVNLSIPAVMLKENLLGGPQDVFMHSWSPKFRKTLEALYHPKVAQFDVNTEYAGEISQMVQKLPHGKKLEHVYNHVSMVLSISKVLKAIAEYQEESGHVYDSIYLCRPDVLLRGKVDLNRSVSRMRYLEISHIGEIPGRLAVPQEDFAEDVVFHPAGALGHADFHYLMSGRHAKIFSTIFDSLPDVAWVEAVRNRGGIVAHSGWMEEFLRQHGLRLKTADTAMSFDEEVYQKVAESINVDEWRSYLAPLMPPQCLDQFFSGSRRARRVNQECLVDI
jgi:hypothetical protein